MSRALGLALALLVATGCASCPPSWLEQLPAQSGWLYARGSVGELGLPIAPEQVALGRAARVVAARLGLEVTSESAVRVDGRLIVEVAGPEGVHERLEALEFVGSARCDGRLHVLVRLPNERS